jgi:hypothetical protein
MLTGIASFIPTEQQRLTTVSGTHHFWETFCPESALLKVQRPHRNGVKEDTLWSHCAFALNLLTDMTAQEVPRLFLYSDLLLHRCLQRISVQSQWVAWNSAEPAVAAT